VSERAAPAAAIEDFEYVKQRSLWLDAFERLIRNKAAMMGLFISVAFLFVGVFGGWLAPKDYLRTNIYRVAEPPNSDFWLGTDLVGRDVLSRLMHGARTAVFVAVVTIVIGNAIGISVGALAGYMGGKIDDLIMRITDVLFSFPDLLLAAFLSTSVRRPVVEAVGRLYNQTGWGILKETIFLDYIILFGALAMVNWSGIARLIRGQVLSLREQEFIRAEVALGMPRWVVIRRHLIPNAMAPVIVVMSLSVGSVMLSESSLSFLGLGIQPPGASWGNMIQNNLVLWRIHPWLVAIPGVTLSIAVFGFNFLGDGLNDALDPRQIRR
jgi:ABC-type dipeptide/oligopeptide/nickel transport system permease subunit